MTVPSQKPPAQYDHIGKTYNCVEQLPASTLLERFVQSQIGNVCDLSVLELACGTGYYSRKLLEWGAKEVIGVDISSAMVENARTQSQGDARLQFLVADCSQPLQQGQSDLILASWLLNYASNSDELLTMWRNIFNNLKPGSRFVGVLPNYRLLEPPMRPVVDAGDYRYGGVGITVLDHDNETSGTRVQTTFHTATPVNFTSYMLPKSSHEKCAKLAGMQSLRWVEAEPSMDRGSLQPVFQIVTAERPQLN
ncbi:S-adenosyl-L-methionine-dependent methyltransferase [Aspergillus ambiguus]|uniref:class I SAM-dependent methyltransferase n=1 Tax=Aspergillus ambiguus TaxID=176160 RepID=UPI003CCD1D50